MEQSFVESYERLIRSYRGGRQEDISAGPKHILTNMNKYEQLT